MTKIIGIFFSPDQNYAIALSSGSPDINRCLFTIDRITDSWLR